MAGTAARAASRTSPRRAGVSLGTVSNVLNRPDRVSAQTRGRVEQAMADLGFVRNESARQLRAGRSSTLAYVMLDATQPVLHRRRPRASRRPPSRPTCPCSSATATAAPTASTTYLNRLEQQRVQGILITPVDPDDPRCSTSRRAAARRSSSSTAPAAATRTARSPSTTCSVAGSPSSTCSTWAHRASRSSAARVASARCATGARGAVEALDGRRTRGRRPGRGRHRRR